MATCVNTENVNKAVTQKQMRDAALRHLTTYIQCFALKTLGKLVMNFSCTKNNVMGKIVGS